MGKKCVSTGNRAVVAMNEKKIEYARLITDQRLSADIKDQMSVRLVSDTTVHQLTDGREVFRRRLV